MAVITRRLTDENCERAKRDLSFLLGYLDNSRFRRELAIEFRGPSELSVYDRGFRLAQIRFGRDGDYRVSTHKRFIKGTPLEDHPRFRYELAPNGTTASFRVDRRSIHPLLKAQHIASMRTRIKEIPFKEEIGVAHVIAADSMHGTDVVVIDREVGDRAPEHRAERLDLLALQQTEAGAYRFLAIEVKLGNNPELNTGACARAGRRSAVEQVEGYAAQIDRYFEDYQDCYRKNVEQKLALGLLKNWSEPPEIVRDTRAMLVVVGYTGIAEPHLRVIEHDHPDLWVKTFGYGLRSRDGRVEGLRQGER